MIGCILAVLLPAAQASHGPEPGLWAEVGGQEVTATIRVYADGDPGLDETFDLVRRDRDGEVVPVFEGRQFDLGEHVGTGGLCWRYHGGGDTASPGCDEEPEGCLDCNGDEVPECPADGTCWSGYDFVVVDSCVPRGKWEYRIDASRYSWAAHVEAHATLLVEDVDPACGDEAAGCRGCTAAAVDPGWFLALGMGLVGLVAWRRPR